MHAPAPNSELARLFESYKQLFGFDINKIQTGSQLVECRRRVVSSEP